MVPATVPAGWLGAGVLPGTPMLVTGVAMVSNGVVKGSSEVAVGAGAVGGEALRVPGDVLPSGVVAAGPWRVLVPSVVPTQVEGRRVEVGGGSALVLTPNELTARAVLVPTDVTMVVSAQLGVIAMGVGVGVPVVSPSSVGVPVVSRSAVGVGSGCTVVPAGDPGVLWAVLPLVCGVVMLEAAGLLPRGVAALAVKASVSTSGVEVSGLEGGRVAAVVELVVGSSAVVCMGVEEVGRVGDMVTVTSVVVVPAKRWENEVRKGWWWKSETLAVLGMAQHHHHHELPKLPISLGALGMGIHCPAWIKHADPLNGHQQGRPRKSPSLTKQEQAMGIAGRRAETPVGTSTKTRSTTCTHSWCKSDKPIRREELCRNW